MFSNKIRENKIKIMTNKCLIKLSLVLHHTSKQQKLDTREAECTEIIKGEFVNNYSQIFQDLQINITH